MPTDAEIEGGDEGGARNPSRLRPSELLTLRRLADRFPFTPEDRIRAVGVINDTLSDAEANHRTKQGALRAMAEFERLNLAEVAMGLNAAKNAPEVTAPNVNITNVIQVHGSTAISLDDFKRLPPEERVRLMRAALAASPRGRIEGPAGV